MSDMRCLYGHPAAKGSVAYSGIDGVSHAHRNSSCPICRSGIYRNEADRERSLKKLAELLESKNEYMYNYILKSSVDPNDWLYIEMAMKSYERQLAIVRSKLITVWKNEL